MTTIFQRAVNHILEIEKGYINHPLDAGGPTNFGITMRTLSKWRNGAVVTAEDVKNLTQAEAENIYFEMFWIASNIYKLPGAVLSIAVFDQFVNRGLVAIKLLQKILEVEQDGIIGPKTLTAASVNAANVVQDYIFECQLSYVRLVESRPDQIVFLRGWLARTHKLICLGTILDM